MKNMYVKRDGTFYEDDENHKALFDWARDHENPDLRQVGWNVYPDGVFVSTIWIGINTNLFSMFGNDEKPYIFETLVFGGEHDQKGRRYQTEEEAIKGHQYFCDLVEGKIKE